MDTVERKSDNLKSKILTILNNPQECSQKEIDDLWEEVKKHLNTLESTERGAFHWNSCSEAFFLLTTESNGDLNKNQKEQNDK